MCRLVLALTGGGGGSFFPYGNGIPFTSQFALRNFFDKLKDLRIPHVSKIVYSLPS
jgi:hypothetical protein